MHPLLCRGPETAAAHADFMRFWNCARSSASSTCRASSATRAGPSSRENGRSGHSLRTASFTNTLAMGPRLAESALVQVDRNADASASVTEMAEELPPLPPVTETDQLRPLPATSARTADVPGDA